jgi:copper oxidase (laccase) domain-containing protein
MRELYLLRQVHGAVVVTISDPLLAKTTQTEDLPLRVVGEGDALILPRNFLRNSTGAVGVRSADCVPLLLEVEGAVAAVHAGWRGLAVGVIPRTLQALREYGADLRVLVGPCADATHYAVGAEVPHQIGQDAVVTTAEGGELLLDLSGSAVRQIERQWPGSVSIVVSALGTISNPSLHSYRREGKGVGSNLSAICFR